MSANVGILDFDPEYSQRYKIIEAGGMKIGVTSVLGKKQIAALKNSGDLTLVEPVSGDSAGAARAPRSRLRSPGAAVVRRPGGNEATSPGGFPSLISSSRPAAPKSRRARRS